jgi:murein peptide amidase A
MPIAPAVLAALLAMSAPPTSGPATSTSTSTSTSVPDQQYLETIPIGMSVEGRPIDAVRRGDPDGRRVLIIGVIHGDEQAGLQIVALLGTQPVPPGVDLYLVEAMNPDGVANDTRGNANGVDLNRNFPYNWGPIAAPGDWQYAGPEAASEPETRAVVDFVSAVQPDLLIWYHQDLFTIARGQGRDGAIRDRYAELTGLPRESPAGGTYTGVAAQWARQQLAANERQPGVAFIVELGETLSAEEALVHAQAVLTIAGELD